MKKSGQFFPLLAILMLLAACAGKSQAADDSISGSDSISVSDTTATAAANAFTYQSVTFYDSIMHNGEDIVTRIHIDLPQGDSKAALYIKSWLQKNMHNSLYEFQSYVPSVLTKESITAMGKKSISFQKNRDNSYFFSFINISCKCLMLTPNAVSYWCDFVDSNEISPMGGGHPEFGLTYDLVNNSPLTWDIVPAANKTKLAQVIYSLANQNTGTSTQVQNWLSKMFGMRTLPESQYPPVFTPKGVKWVCHYNGIPDYCNVVIPYDKLRGIVTPEIEALFPPKSKEETLMDERKALIPARVKEIYKTDYSTRDKFLTAEYKRISYLAEDLIEPGYASVIDWDPWTGGQDEPNNPKYSAGQIKMFSPDKATVTIIQTSDGWGGSPKRETRECSELELIWVNNNWYVNDVGGTLEVYKDFLKENHKSY